MKVTVSRKAHFNAAHKLYRKDWSDKKNIEFFGKCSNQNYHGHNYEVIVSLKGNINPETGFVYDLSVLKEIIKENIEEKLDHKNLNLDVPEFSNLNPTAENIVVFIYDELRKHIEKDLELEVTLYETPRNFVKFSGEN
tara:strand:+ start:1268 stop:1681 length:414 start_codon:yes stop_codon:yes gene_type:complete